MKNFEPVLIIVDMQKGMQSYKPDHRNNPQAESNIAKLLAAWRQTGGLVIHVRHMSRTVGSVFWPGQIGAEFQDELQPLNGEHVVEKNVPDAFINSGLERWLRVRNINDVVIVGVSTNNSVEATARSAGNLGFKAIVVADGTYAYDQVDYAGTLRDADVVHAMALSNLDGEYAMIMTTNELLKAR
ncbi:cysteine hydrolase family protein [Solimicrobium silvestre]|uniref:Amidases related to nicotinamidase n=1 Tax=Solimicrobium silvestre TaxID=2099400 RepID=A0A2S9H4B2_9BURK|nr:cysteine hydrolase family protein [Solimicrobium silvestre]PRC94822.1 Amidases related to nicotinamidase [Solimicrobium silvestre]